MKGRAERAKSALRGSGQGKSVGYRVITYYAADDVPVFLLICSPRGDSVEL